MNHFAQEGLVTQTAELALVVLSAAMLLALIRIVRGPGLPDRVVALDLMVTIAVGLMATYAIATRETAILDAAIMAALIMFLGTTAFASYLERGGRR